MDSEEKKVVGMEVKIPDCVDKTIENLTAPLAKSVGTTLADLWYLVFGSISTSAEKKRIIQETALENFKNNLKKRIETIQEDKRVMPDTQIVGGALYDSRFCVDKDALRSMFENLIASSLSSDTVSNVHPSFSGIIRQMTCEDAHMLARFKTVQALPIVSYLLSRKEGSNLTLYNNVITASQDVSRLKFESLSLECLQSLGLLTLCYTQHLTDESKYTPLITAPCFQKLKQHITEHPEIYPEASFMNYHKGIAFLTDLGIQFISICMP